MVRCPYCHYRAMNLWDKLKTGRVTKPCANCGRQLAISRWSVLAVISPLFIGGLVADRTASLGIGALSITVGAIIAVLLLVFLMPMVGRDT